MGSWSRGSPAPPRLQWGSRQFVASHPWELAHGVGPPKGLRHMGSVSQGGSSSVAFCRAELPSCKDL
eukprot:12907447-Prorocentrum_lima.AAC.1